MAEREVWRSKLEFFFSCLGYGIGYGNIWRFPFLCYKNGGATFLIAYFLMLLFTGIPIFFMEFALGQYASTGPVIIFQKMAPILNGVGYGMVVITVLFSIYYPVILAWVFFYFFSSFNSVLPWEGCDHDFNSPNCYTLDAARNCSDQGMLYYNDSCVEAEEMCQLNGGLHSYNNTHCIMEGSTFQLVSLDLVYNKISASEDYYRNRMLGMRGRSWKNLGKFRWELVGCLALSWTILSLCVIKGIKSSGKVVYVTAMLPYFVLIALVARALTLPGSYSGIEFYILKPNMTKLLEIEVWNDAATQIFFTLGVACGVLITMASYNPLHFNCLRVAMIVPFCICSTSVFAGLVIFSILGFIANELGVEVKDVIQSGSGLAFISYPEAVTKMPISPLWSFLFFLMMINIGISSMVPCIETIAATIFDSFEHLRPWKSYINTLICVALFLLGLTMCLEGGVYMFELFVWYSTGMSLIVFGLIEVIAVHYIYGFKNFWRKIREEMEIRVPTPIYAYLSISWLVLTPASLLIILLFSVYYYIPAYYGDYMFPPKVQKLGWLMCASSIICVPIGILWVACTSGKSLKELFHSKDLRPAHFSEKSSQYENATSNEPQASKVVETELFPKAKSYPLE